MGKRNLREDGREGGGYYWGYGWNRWGGRYRGKDLPAQWIVREDLLQRETVVLQPLSRCAISSVCSNKGDVTLASITAAATQIDKVSHI